MLAALLAVESARRKPLSTNRTLLAKINGIAPRLIASIQVPGAHGGTLTDDGKRLLIASGVGDSGAYSVWDVALQRELLRVPAKMDIDFTPPPRISPDGRWLAFHSRATPNEVWDVDAKHRLRLLDYSLPQVIDLSVQDRLLFSPSGRWLAELSDKDEVAIWSVPDWERHRVLKHGAKVLQIAFGQNDEWVVSRTTDGDASIWSLSNIGETGTPLGKHGAVSDIAASHNSPLILTGGNETRVFRFGNGLQLLGSLPKTSTFVILSDEGSVGAGYHEDDDFADESYLQTFRINGEVIQPLSQIRSRSNGLVFDPMGSEILDFLCGDMYDVATGRLKGRIEADGQPCQLSRPTRNLTRILASAGERLIVFEGRFDRSTPNPESAPPSYSFELARSEGYGFTASSPDSRFSAMDDMFGTLRILANGRPYLVLEQVPAGGFHFSEEGRYIVRSDRRLEPILTDDLVRATCARMTRAEWKRYLGG